jgi:hypothetical protein
MITTLKFLSSNTLSKVRIAEMEEDNVIKFPGTEEIDFQIVSDEHYGPDIDVDEVLESAKGKGLNNIIIIGTYDDSDNFYLASTSGSLPKNNWDLDRAKHVLMLSGFSNITGDE